MAVAVAWSARGGNSPEEPFVPEVDTSPKRKEPQHTAEGTGKTVTPPHREHSHRAAQTNTTPRARRRLGAPAQATDPIEEAGREDGTGERQPEREIDETEEEVQLPDTRMVWEAERPQHDALATELMARGMLVVYEEGKAYSLWRALARSEHPFFDNSTPEE
eukprot:1922462-Rhodomonas_salina.1